MASVCFLGRPSLFGTSGLAAVACRVFAAQCERVHVRALPSHLMLDRLNIQQKRLNSVKQSGTSTVNQCNTMCAVQRSAATLILLLTVTGI